MFRFKKLLILRNIVLVSGIVVLPLPILITSCATATSSSIDQEVQRVNNLDLSFLRINQLTSDQLSKITESNFLDYLENWSPDPNYNYNVIFKNSNNLSGKITFQIKISSKNDTSLTKLSKEFVASYTIISSNDLTVEINRINSLTLTIKQKEFTIEQLDDITDINFINLINGLDKNSSFTYSIANLSMNNGKFTFNIKVQFKNNSNVLAQISKLFEIPYSFIAPSSPATTVDEELNRLKIATPVLFKPTITKQELIDMNLNNFLYKVKGLNLDYSKFKYKMNYLRKDENMHIIEFNFLVAKSTDISFDANKWTNPSFRVPYTLVKEDFIPEPVDTNYFKNNANPITTGANSFSTPGNTPNNSVNPSYGPSVTQPSLGVNQTAELSTSKVYNQIEINQLKNTFSLGFKEYNDGYAFGTGWILDYKLTEDGSYPTTWYLATNAHVIQNLKIPNDQITPDRYDGDNYYDTELVSIETVNNPQVNVNYGNSTDQQSNFIHVEVPANKCKTIFIGNDYLTTSPRMFSTSPKWSDTEEYIDFAVMEVTFASPEEAKKITQDYVNDSQRHFKYRQESILKNNTLNKPNYFSILGFPVIEESSYWRKTQLTSSRPVNDSNNPLNSYDDLSNLSTSPFYNTYTDKKGVFDSIIALSYMGYDYRQAYGLETYYNLWGLASAIDYGNLAEGASGSMLMDKDGFTDGIFFGGDDHAKVGVVMSLYCEGFNYQNKFGIYNLEGYDLIKGGFPNQKISYRENLQKLYGNEFKTKLFPQGVQFS
ncbi:MIP family Ig-specific serine endopeptidase [Mycoplasmoides alvi]|uniref:MIP family Ig-specific serine endopeptidase n=1 Tax=Mycoplasmoides alvi TaxID=78580 RepID=UPI00051C59A8|nr:DUF31 family protein [Mycoplasmoides alvi]